MINYHYDIIQGSDEWFAARCGLLTASEMKLIITAKTLKYSESEKEKTHLYELAAQRTTKYVEPVFTTFEMARGKDDESFARELYHENYDKVETCGFVTNDRWGFMLGYSPDGLVGVDGQLEGKSRKQKYQFETIVHKKIPEDFIIQVQTGLLVTEREWCDFTSYRDGMKMITLRAYPDLIIQDAIAAAADKFESKMKIILQQYNKVVADPSVRLIDTERRIEEEMHL